MDDLTTLKGAGAAETRKNPMARSEFRTFLETPYITPGDAMLPTTGCSLYAAIRSPPLIQVYAYFRFPD